MFKKLFLASRMQLIRNNNQTFKDKKVTIIRAKSSFKMIM